MCKTIITSILTTLIVLAAAAQPWFIFLPLWIGSGAISVYLIKKYVIDEEPPLEAWLSFSACGPIGAIVLVICCWSEIKEKFKFQLPIKKND